MVVNFPEHFSRGQNAQKNPMYKKEGGQALQRVRGGNELRMGAETFRKGGESPLLERRVGKGVRSSPDRKGEGKPGGKGKRKQQPTFLGEKNGVPTEKKLKPERGTDSNEDGKEKDFQQKSSFVERSGQTIWGGKCQGPLTGRK